MVDVQAIPVPANIQDRTGRTYGRLKVIGYAGRRGGKHAWLCQCECRSGPIVATGSNLQTGNTQSCGCYMRERSCEANITHGRNLTTEHVIWGRMKQRCLDPNCPAFPRYGGRQPHPITVCKRWLDFSNFFADMGERPKDLTLERLKNEQGYHCGHCEECLANGWELNCAWRSRTDQARNRRSNRLLTHDGLTLTIAEWAERTGINQGTILSRVKRGWSATRTLTSPLDPRGSNSHNRTAKRAAK